MDGRPGAFSAARDEYVMGFGAFGSDLGARWISKLNIPVEFVAWASIVVVAWLLDVGCCLGSDNL